MNRADAAQLKVVGVTFENRQVRLAELAGDAASQSTVLAKGYLKAEPQNPHDPRATAVYVTVGDHTHAQIGYLARAWRDLVTDRVRAAVDHAIETRLSLNIEIWVPSIGRSYGARAIVPLEVTDAHS